MNKKKRLDGDFKKSNFNDNGLSVDDFGKLIIK